MLNLFKKKPKISKILISSQKNTDIVFYLFESIKNSHDDFETIAYLRTPYYHSFGKVSQKQFESLNEDFNFQQGELIGKEPTMDELIKHGVSIHKTYEQAKEENYRLNLAFIYSFYWSEKRISELSEKEKDRYLNFTLEDNLTRYDSEFATATEQERSEFTPKNKFIQDVIVAKYSHHKYLSIKDTLESLQKHPVLELVYNDYNESIFNKKVEFSHKDKHHFVFVNGNFNPVYSQCKTVKELINSILDVHNQKVDNAFRKEMTNYVVANLTNTSEKTSSSLYTLNQNLLNRLIFISEYLYFSDYSWNEIQLLVERFENNDYYFNESLFYPCTSLNGQDDSENYHAFRKHLLFLQKQKFDIYNVLKYWNLYTTTMKQTSKLIDEVSENIFNPKNYKDLNRSYNFLGKKLAEGIENFEFKNFNGENFNNNIHELNTMKIDEYTVRVITDFKDLMNCGMILDSCAGSKATLESYTDKITFVLMQNDQIKFMGCIKNGQFNQLKGYKNASPSFELFVTAFNTLQNSNFIDKIENQHLRERYVELFKGDIWRGVYEQECVQH